MNMTQFPALTKKTALSNTTKKPVLDFKKACLTKNIEIKPIIKEVIKPISKSEEEIIRQGWDKALEIMYNRWEKYKMDYNEIHGEYAYEEMYTCPNLWIMPEDPEEYEDTEQSMSENDYYDSYDEYYSDGY